MKAKEVKVTDFSCPVCEASEGELCRTGGKDADTGEQCHYPEGQEHARRGV